MGIKFIVLTVATALGCSAVAWYIMERARQEDIINLEEEG